MQEISTGEAKVKYKLECIYKNTARNNIAKYRTKLILRTSLNLQFKPILVILWKISNDILLDSTRKVLQ